MSPQNNTLNHFSLKDTAFLSFLWLLIVLGFVVNPVETRAQSGFATWTEPGKRSSMDLIKEDFRRGILTEEQHIRHLSDAVFNPEALSPAYTRKHQGILKCAFPLIAHSQVGSLYKSGGTSRAQNALLAADQQITSPSGKFIIHYSTQGDNAVPSSDSNENGIPDYIDITSMAVDSVWNYYVNVLDYVDWIGEEPYSIAFEDTMNAFGFTEVIGSNQTAVVLHANYEGFPPNTHPDGNVVGALLATIGHELKHSSQFVYTRWRGESTLWLEMDATHYEDISFDDVNDYYNYQDDFDSIFSNAERSMYPGSYPDAAWARFFTEKWTELYWPEVWKQIANGADTWMQAMILVHKKANLNLEADIVQNQLWHFASGDNAEGLEDFGFVEKAFYPSVDVARSGDILQVPMLEKSPSMTLEGLSARRFKINPGRNDTGRVVIKWTYSRPSLGIGLLIRRKDGMFHEEIILANTTRTDTLITLNHRWEEAETLFIVVANTDLTTRFSSGRLGAEHDVAFSFLFTDDPNRTIVPRESVPKISQTFELKQNFPNPFNPSTTIAFSLEQAGHVHLRVYDVMGRLIQTLVDQPFSSGTHQVIFDARTLASGVYLYRLEQAGRSQQRRFTLIK